MLAHSRKVWVTGMGTVNCTGKSPDALWLSVLAKESFIKNGFGLVSPDLLSSLQDTLLRIFPSAGTSARVKQLFRSCLTEKFTIMTLYALGQAMQSAGWNHLESDDAIFFATTTGQIPSWESDLMDYLDGKISAKCLAETLQYESLGLALKNSLDLIGAGSCHSQIIASACSASTQALILAALWLRAGKAKRCLVGGTELLCQLTSTGFHSLQLLSATPATPFDQNRMGINLAEASAFLCLETEPKNSPLALLAGGGMASDGYHMTSPEPEGEGLGRAMEQALNEAGLQLSQIDWIHAHGTGSLANDAAEAKAIQKISGKHPLISSTKPVHGHTLAVSGVLEAIICLMGIKNQLVPPTRGLVLHDWAGDLSLPKEPQHRSIKHVLKNSLGFGGANAAAIFSACAT